MKRVTIRRVCDLPHKQEEDAADTITITTAEGRAVVDVCAAHKANFRLAVQPYTTAAGFLPGKPVKKRSVITKEDREWLRSRGFTVADKGRLRNGAAAELAGRNKLQAVAS